MIAWTLWAGAAVAAGEIVFGSWAAKGVKLTIRSSGQPGYTVVKEGKTEEGSWMIQPPRRAPAGAWMPSTLTFLPEGLGKPYQCDYVIEERVLVLSGCEGAPVAPGGDLKLKPAKP